MNSPPQPDDVRISRLATVFEPPTAPNDTSSPPPPEQPAPGGSAVEPEEDTSTEAGTAEPPEDPAHAPPPEGADTALAREQVPLNSKLPPAPAPRASRHTPRRSTTLTRHNPTQEFFSRSVRSLEPISDLEAASFAGRFATDFQSFDQDDPNRRAEVLRPLLADPQASTWGWSGAGRQRADSPLPGRLYRPGDTVVFVEVIVRVTTYARACPPPETPRPAGSAAEGEVPGLLGPSCAPPEADPAWTADEANWVRMTVPITRDDDGHLVVDPHLRPTDPS